MSTNFFDQSEEEFRDQPEEVSGLDQIEILQQQQPGPVVPRRVPLPPPQQLQPEIEQEDLYDVTEELDLEEDEDDYSAVLSDARLRLEQGRLYEMIMNHDLFEGMDSDPQAIKHVQKQIRKFAKEQMEIMLGMRRETAKVEHLEIDFPFNEIEVKVLKMLASKASGGVSENSDKFVPSVKRVKEEVPVIEKKNKLNSIVGKKPAQQPAPAPKSQQKQQPSQSALRTQPKQPLQRKAASSSTPESIVVEGELVTRDQIDSTFEPGYKPLQKPLHEMSSEELLRRNQETSQRRHKTVKNPSALPMPTYEQEEMMHLQRVADTAGKNNAVALIMNAMNQKK